MQAFSTSSSLCLFVCLLFLKNVSSLNDHTFYCQINQERVKYGAAPLLVDPRIESAASKHSSFLASSGGLLSYIGNKTSPGDRLDKCGFTWSAAAELLSSGSPPLTFWLNDPDRRETLLSKEFKSFGLGLTRSSKGSAYYVLDLGTAEDSAAKGVLPQCQQGNVTKPMQQFDYLGSVNSYLDLKKRPQVTSCEDLGIAARIRVDELVAFASTNAYLSSFSIAKLLDGVGYPIGSYYLSENCYPRGDSAYFLNDVKTRTDIIPDEFLCKFNHFTGPGFDNLICTVIIYAKDKQKIKIGTPATDKPATPATDKSAAPAADKPAAPATDKPSVSAATDKSVAPAATDKPAAPAADKPVAAPAVPATKPGSPAAPPTPSGATPEAKSAKDGKGY